MDDLTWEMRILRTEHFNDEKTFRKTLLKAKTISTFVIQVEDLKLGVRIPRWKKLFYMTEMNKYLHFIS